VKIRAVVADVDGVMVGKRPGFNFPLPHASVIDALKRVNKNGIPVILCTAKFYVGIKQIAVQAHLDNPHITDGGALIINLVRNEIVREHAMGNALVRRFSESCLKNDLYLELYSATSYFVQKSQKTDFTDRRSQLLQLEPILVDSLNDIANHEKIMKMIFFARDPDKQKVGYNLTMNLGDSVHFIWSHHPFLDPWKPGVLTAVNVSKVNAMTELLEALHIPAESVLGIGDSKSDWNFMEQCGTVAVVGDKDQELCELARTKGDGNYFLAPSVDDHGIIEILKRYQLI
jgi:hydroxymethylpyrimidine pyrophosphatase-like HAD family hydrolase